MPFQRYGVVLPVITIESAHVVESTMLRNMSFAEKSLIVEGKREKKKVDRLTMQVSSLQKEPFTITPGKLVHSYKNSLLGMVIKPLKRSGLFVLDET